MQSIVVFFTLLALSLAAPQGDETPPMMEAPEYALLTQAKIVELYEFLKTELEGDDDLDEMEPVELDMEPLDLDTDESARKKRSAEAKPFFWRWLFGYRRRHGYGHRRSYRKHY